MPGLTTLYVLRVLHVLFGAFWVGAVVVLAVLLVPSIRAAGPAGGAVMRELMEVRRLPIWLMAAGAITILSGFSLYWIDSAGFSSAWLGSGPGRVFGLGGVMALVAMILGMGVNAPTARRLTTLAGAIGAAGRKPTPEEAAQIGRLQGRLNKATAVAAILLVLAALAMAVARYVP